ncbi:MAG: hypothetical protein D6785_08050, partial [Planctomycetota bacterium]
NVWEWCEDSFSIEGLDIPLKAVKGGGFRNIAENLKIGFTIGESPESCAADRGFRCVWSPSKKK